MTPQSQRALHWLGSGLAISGVFFLASRLHEYWASLNFSSFTPSTWASIAALSIIYGGANVLLALAWRCLLQQFGVHVPALWAIRTYGVSQLAKYLPGNIFHLAGRHAIGMSVGLPSGALAKSILWELCLIILAGATCGILGLSQIIPGLTQIELLVLFLATSILEWTILNKLFGNHCATAFFQLLCFLAISGLVFVAISAKLSTTSELGTYHILTLCGAYILAWLIGMITPGAPAGVGVRELVLLLLVKGMLTEPDLLVAVLTGRIVTVSGDFIYFLSSLTLNRSKTGIK